MRRNLPPLKSLLAFEAASRHLACGKYDDEGSGMICVSHLTALDAPPEEFLNAVAAAGFEGVGLRIFPPKHAPQWRFGAAGYLAAVEAMKLLLDPPFEVKK